MKTRTSVVLAVVAAGLLAFIMLYERRRPTTDELEARSDRVLLDFSRDAVDRIILGDGDDRVELARQNEPDGDAGPVGSVGSWRILHPLDVRADDEAVDNLLNALDWLERRRTIEEEGALSEARYGLNEPRARVSLRLRGRDVTLLLGGEAPGEALYAAIEGDADRVFAVNREILDDVTLEAGDLRDKRLADVRLPAVQALRIKGRFHVEREGALRWHLSTPVAMRADASAVESIVRALESLRVTRFVEDGVDESDLDRFGLAAGVREVTVRLDGEESPVVLRVGAPCEGHSGELYATSLGTGTVACVSNDFADELQIDPAALRDMKATRLRASAVDGITIVRGDRELSIERSGGEWRIEGEEELSADGEAVEGFLEALRDAVAEEIEEELGPTTLAGAEPRADAEVRLRLSEEEGEGAEVLRFALSAQRTLLRRGSEEVALVLPPDLSEMLVAEPVRFRSRQVLDERAPEVVEIEVRRGTAIELVRKVDDTWQVVEPIEHRADDTVLREIVRSLAGLTAERFVASSATPGHGLTSPRLAVTLRLEGASGGQADGGSPDDGEGESREHQLLLGAPAEGGYYARLVEEDAVFVVGEELVESLSGPLIDRDLFAFDEDAARRVVIERGEDRLELSRSDDGWLLGEAETDAAPVDRMLSRLAVMRAAAALGYGPPPSEAGLASPRARVTIELGGDERDSPSQLVILVGAEQGQEDERTVSVQRADVEASFAAPARAVQPIFELGIREGE